MSSLSKKSSRVLPYIIISIGLIMSLSSGYSTYNYYKEKERLHFELVSNEITILIKTRMAAYEQVLRSGIAFFNASNKVTRNEWMIFVKEQKLDKNFKGIQGFGYSEIVLPKNKTKYETAIRESGFPDFKIRPEGKRELYTSIIYLEPFDERNQRAFGYDMFSEKVRNKAMTYAMQSGEATMSGKIKLVQEKDKDIQAGFLIYLPVYKKNYPIDTIHNRILATQGFVYGAFRANDLMDGILGKMFSSIDFEIYDGDNLNKENKIYNSNNNYVTPTLQKKVHLKINEHTWTILFTSSADSTNENIYMPLILSSFGFILTLLLYLLLSSLVKTKETAQQIARRATQKLHTSEERLRYALEGTGDGLWDWNLKTDEIYFSKSWKEMFGFEEDEIDNHFSTWKSRIHPEDLEQVNADIQQHIEGKSDSYVNEHRIQTKNGSYKWILDRGLIVNRDANGTPIRMVASYSDVTKRKESDVKLKEYVNIIDKNVISSTTDLTGTITKISEAYCDISGYTKDELIGNNHSIARHKDMPTSLYKELWSTIQSGKVWHGEIKNMHKNGSAYWVDVSISPIMNDKKEIVSYTAVHHDITDKKRIEELSITDTLTQLYNRLKLDEIFAMKLATARRYNTAFSVIILDIDYFKLVNDTWGHQAGDDVLSEFAKLIKNNIRETDIVGRWGGEEFLILSSDTDLTAAIELAEKLREIISLFKFPFAGKKTASFGVSTYHPGDDKKSIVKRADEALYTAKAAGRNSVKAEVYIKS